MDTRAAAAAVPAAVFAAVSAAAVSAAAVSAATVLAAALRHWQRHARKRPLEETAVVEAAPPPLGSASRVAEWPRPFLDDQGLGSSLLLPARHERVGVEYPVRTSFGIMCNSETVPSISTFWSASRLSCERFGEQRSRLRWQTAGYGRRSERSIDARAGGSSDSLIHGTQGPLCALENQNNIRQFIATALSQLSRM
jgi:hypothetical protein